MNRAAVSAGEGVLFRTAMSNLSAGVVVITVGGEHPHGMTANSVTSVSLRPPKILVCVVSNTKMHYGLARTETFGISILGAHQTDIARYFADKRRPEGQAQFGQVRTTEGPVTGVPLVNDALAWLECAIDDLIACGDHMIVLGDVRAAVDLNPSAAAGLTYFRSVYSTTTSDSCSRAS